MLHRGAVVIVFALLGAGAVAHAGDDDDLGDDDAVEAPGDDDEDDGSEPKLIVVDAPSSGGDDDVRFKDHWHQFGVSLQIPFGLRVIKPYDTGEYCGESGENEMQNAEVCVGRTPQSFDFAFAYGLKKNLEVLLELRLGIERDFGTRIGAGGGPRLFHWSPGVKFYFSDSGTAKLFSTAQLAFDHTGYDDSSGDARGLDVALRNVNGLQLDLHQSYGVYFFVGAELAFRRWLMLAVEAGIGIQGRYP